MKANEKKEAQKSIRNNVQSVLCCHVNTNKFSPIYTIHLRVSRIVPFNYILNSR